MNEYDLLETIGDIKDEYIENAGAEEEHSEATSKEIRCIRIRERRKKAVSLAGCLVGIAITVIIVGMVTKYYFASKGVDSHKDNHPVDETKDELPAEKVELYEKYQYLCFYEELYLSSKEECVNVGAFLGIFCVTSDIEGNNADAKEVSVYKVADMDESLAVAVFYEEEQTYHMYYNSVIR